MYDRHQRHDPEECEGDLDPNMDPRQGVFQCPDCGEIVRFDEKPSRGVASSASPVGTAEY